MPFDFHSGLKGALRTVTTRPVRLPWVYAVSEEDNFDLPAGTLLAIELDVPRIESKEWQEALDGVSVASIAERAKSPQSLLDGLLFMDEESRNQAVVKRLEKSGAKKEQLCRREFMPWGTKGVDATEIPTVLVKDATTLCSNGKRPAPIRSAITSGRLVPIEIKATERRKLLEVLNVESWSEALADDEMIPVETEEPVELSPEALSSVLAVAPDFDNDHPEASLCLPSPIDARAPKEPAHVAVVRHIVRAASEHSAYEQRLEEKKSSSDGGEPGENERSASSPSTKKKASSGRRKRSSAKPAAHRGKPAAVDPAPKRRGKAGKAQ